LTSAPKIPLPPDAPNKTRYLEREEIELLLSNCIESHVKLFVLLAINTGARKGAILDLNWAQIDFNNKIIHLNPEGRQQTNKRRAIVPISDALMTALNDQRQELKKLQEEAAAAGEPMQMCPYVISYRNGPIANIKVGFRMACERAGLVGVTPHTLRHTAGSLMAIAERCETACARRSPIVLCLLSNYGVSRLIIVKNENDYSYKPMVLKIEQLLFVLILIVVLLTNDT